MSNFNYDEIQKLAQEYMQAQMSPFPGAMISARSPRPFRTETGRFGVVDQGKYAKRMRIEKKRCNLRAADGALIGYRYWKLAPSDNEGNRGYFLVSPTQYTVWHGPVLEAHKFSESAMCKGYAGIHARHKRGVVSSFSLLEHKTKVTSHVWGRVRGYGQFVRGSDGWRAQRVMVDKLWLPTILNLTNGVTIIPNLMKSWGIDLADQLATRYECRVVTPREKPIIHYSPEELYL